MTTVLAQSPTLKDFGHDTWWIVLIKVVGIFAFLVVMTLFTINFERKVVGRMQHRPGPNRTGPNGWLQSLADGLKLAFKEDIMPKLADKVGFFLAPVISAICAFTAFAVIPLGGLVSIFGQRTPLQLTDFSVGVLLVLACSGMGIYGVVLAGWASGSTYPLLGGLRSAAQMISYEVAMGLSIVAVFMTAGSMSTSEIVASQEHGRELTLFGHQIGNLPAWYAILLLPSFLIYFVSAVGETNRAPFDLPEAESELVGGFHTEYSSLKFALFFLAEYINMVTVSALCTTLFLGGWRLPWIDHFWHGANTGYWTLVWFSIKVLLLLFVFVWLRGTLPRLRYDQFMRFGWKVLVPVNLVWILLLAGLRVSGTASTGVRLAILAGFAALIILIVTLWPTRKQAEPAQAPAERIPRGSFPIPPLDLVVPPSPRAARVPIERTPAAASSSTEQGE